MLKDLTKIYLGDSRHDDFYVTSLLCTEELLIKRIELLLIWYYIIEIGHEFLSESSIQ